MANSPRQDESHYTAFFPMARLEGPYGTKRIVYYTRSIIVCLYAVVATCIVPVRSSSREMHETNKTTLNKQAAAFVQLTCLSIWLGMSVYATFVWPIITGMNMRDSSEFASLLGKLGPSYLQLSAAMIMSLGTSSLVIGHANVRVHAGSGVSSPGVPSAISVTRR